MRSKNKQILVVGDRVLIRPDKGEKNSKAGLYLPPSVIEKQEILSGIIVLITMWLNYKLFDELTDALGERSNRNE